MATGDALSQPLEEIALLIRRDAADSALAYNYWLLLSYRGIALRGTDHLFLAGQIVGGGV